jgi:hypothetical protein
VCFYWASCALARKRVLLLNTFCFSSRLYVSLQFLV